MDVVLRKILFPEEGFGEEIHVAVASDKTLADCSQIIYIYIQTQLFGISILDLFWRGFGEVLERDFGEQKLQKHCVLQWFLIATIKKPLVFLGFSCFGEVSGSSKVTKTLCFTMFFNRDH